METNGNGNTRSTLPTAQEIIDAYKPGVDYNQIMPVYSLVQDSMIAKREQELLKLINHPVPQHWLKWVKVGGGRSIKYLPIEKIKFSLSAIFGLGWKKEILREGTMFNSMYSCVRLWYRVPGTNIWYFHDGGGAVPAQVDRGSQASDISVIKSNAVQVGYPSATSYALSNAAENIGDFFGRGLNYEDRASYGGSYMPDDMYENNNQNENTYNAQTQTSGTDTSNYDENTGEEFRSNGTGNEAVAQGYDEPNRNNGQVHESVSNDNESEGDFRLAY